MVRARLIAGVAALVWALPIGAHEVSASTVKVFAEGTRLEVQQTTPFKTAYEIAHRLRGNGPVDAAATPHPDGAALVGIALGWSVTSEAGVCPLERQAHRRTHRETQLQMRYLFVCAADATPERIALPWLMQAPEDHFIILELTLRRGGQTSKTTRIFERQPLVVSIPTNPAAQAARYTSTSPPPFSAER